MRRETVPLQNSSRSARITCMARYVVLMCRCDYQWGPLLIIDFVPRGEVGSIEVESCYWSPGVIL
jgi:hypothetical protein